MYSTETNSLTIAPGVIETIISLAVQQVEGVAGLAAFSANNVLQILGRKQSMPGVLVLEEEDGRIVVEVHIHVLYGYPLPDIAAAVRLAVADALDSQVNIAVSEVNVAIEAIQFVG
jgi:uncharacterized alkaline shock family protein YloU